MNETPIARLARRWVKRADRPAGDLPCGSPLCSRTVPEGTGVWLAQIRSVACDEQCAEGAELQARAW